MRRTDVLVLFFALGVTVVPGCYCSHEVHDDAGTEGDGGVDDGEAERDAARDWGPLPDGAPSCVFHCGDATRVATQTIDSAVDGPGGVDWSVVIMDVAATDGAVWLLVRQTARVTVRDDDNIYALHRYDLATHALESMAVTPSIRTHPMLEGANLRVRDDTLRMRALTTLGWHGATPPGDVTLATAAWSMSGSLVAENASVAVSPEAFVPGAASRTAVFGRDALDLAAFAYGPRVQAFVVRDSAAAPEFVDLVTLTDDGELAPLSGAVLDDGRVVIAGGGFGTGAYGLDVSAVRSPFFAVGALEDAPLPALPIVGQPYDPAPVVVAERDGGFALVRAASDPDDLAASAIHVQHYDAASALLRDVVVPTLGGLQPTALGVFTIDGQAGIVWAERVYASATGASARILWPGHDDGCTTVAADPIVHFDTRTRDMRAVLASDGALYVVAVVPFTGSDPAVITVDRVTSCDVQR